PGYVLSALLSPQGRWLLRNLDVGDGTVVPAVPADAGETEKRPVVADDVADGGQVQRAVLHHAHQAGRQARQRRQYLIHLITPHRHQGQLERPVRADLTGHLHPDRDPLDWWIRPGLVDQGDAILDQGLQGLVARQHAHLVPRLVQPGRVDLADHAGPDNENFHVWSRSPVTLAPTRFTKDH